MEMYKYLPKTYSKGYFSRRRDLSDEDGAVLSVRRSPVIDDRRRAFAVDCRVGLSKKIDRYSITKIPKSTPDDSHKVILRFWNARVCFVVFADYFVLFVRRNYQVLLIPMIRVV